MVHRRATRWCSLWLATVLVVTPVALLARPPAHGKAKCTGMCCRPKARHAGEPSTTGTSQAATNRASHREDMSCARGVAAHLVMCLAPSKTEIDYGAVAPLPPVILSTGMPVAGPELFREELPRFSGFSPLGFLPLPFEPPRG